MSDMITRKNLPVEQNWCDELANAVSSPEVLLQQLEIQLTNAGTHARARKLFSQRVPQSFVDRIEKGNPNDPLLLQVMPMADEFQEQADFITDPLFEQSGTQTGFLHKYKNRVLLILKSGCAVNCRYCFRRHFPYQEHKGNKQVWQSSLDYIASHPDVNEVILSGGDPLMAKDEEFAWLLPKIEAISHVKTLRIHTRLPVVIPSRVTETLVSLFQNLSLNVVLVTHINHANEINQDVKNSLSLLRNANVHLLNQSVLLKGINDSVAVLSALSHALFDAGVLPYYLHLLDRVKGASHFLVEDDKARALIKALLAEVSGYLVPRLMREEGGKSSKTPIDLYLD